MPVEYNEKSIVPYTSSLNYDFPVNGDCTESVTLDTREVWDAEKQRKVRFSSLSLERQKFARLQAFISDGIDIAPELGPICDSKIEGSPSKEQMQEARDKILERLGMTIFYPTQAISIGPLDESKELSCQELDRLRQINEEKCICSLDYLMAQGCKCGAMKREREKNEARKQGE